MTNNEVNFMLPNRTHSQCVECSVIERLKSLNEHGMCLDRATCFARIDHNRLMDTSEVAVARMENDNLKADVKSYKKAFDNLHRIQDELRATIKDLKAERDRWLARCVTLEARLEAVRVAIQPAIGASKS